MIDEMEEKLGKVRQNAEYMLRARDMALAASTEYDKLVSDEIVKGISANEAIMHVIGSMRGREVYDLMRIRQRDEIVARSNYNVALLEFEIAHTNARMRILKDEITLNRAD